MPSTAATRPIYAEVDTDWFKDQLAARGRNQRALAKHLGLDPGAVSLMLRGMRKISMQEAAKLSAFLAQPLGEVVARAGIREVTPRNPNEVPIVGHVDGNGEVHFEPDGLGTTPRPPEMVGDDVMAVLHRSLGTAREAYDGWIFYYRRSKIIAPDCIGRLVVAQLSNGGPVYIRIARRGYAPRTFNFVSSIDPPIENARVDWATPVEWIKS